MQSIAKRFASLLSRAILDKKETGRQEDKKWTRHITMTTKNETRNETRKQIAALLDANHLYELFTSYASLARIHGSVIRLLCYPRLIFLV